MGWVYLARDADLGRWAAIKVIRGDYVDSDHARMRLISEARAVARLNHPNIVTLFGAGEHDGLPYLAFEYLEGHTLREQMKRNAVAVDELLEIITSVLAALAEAHARGIIHRDVKPENIFLCNDGRPRLLDFGLARDIERTTSVYSKEGVAGTVGYIAPERWTRRRPTAAVDIWSIGVILFEVLTGGQPQPERLAPEQLTSALADAAPDLDPHLQRLVVSCLAWTPGARPTATTVAAVIERARSNESGRASQARSPFVGPHALRPADAGHRRSLGEQLIRLVQVHSLLWLEATRQAGATSLLAGQLIPRLESMGYAAVLHWQPGALPMEELVRLVAERSSVTLDRPSTSDTEPTIHDGNWRPREGTALRRLANMLTETPALLARWLGDKARANDAPIALFVDRLDALWRPNVPPSTRHALLQALVETVGGEAPIKLVIVCQPRTRERLLGSELACVAAARMTIPVPNADELRSTLEQILAARGYGIADALCEEIAGDIAGQPAPLPLLQLVGAAIWRKRSEEHRVVLQTAYHDLGRTAGVAAAHAEAAVGRLGARLEVVRELMLALVDGGGSATPRRWEDLELLDCSAPLDELLSAAVVAERSDTLLACVHSELCRRWPRLRRWHERATRLSTQQADGGEPAERTPDYQLVRRVACGGMGEIWQGEDRSGRRVAIKRLLVAASDGRFRLHERLQQEGELLASIRHDNVVRLLASGTDGMDRPYLVLEWLDGEDLGERLKRGPLSLGDAIDVCCQALGGLAACHDCGAVHRDLKPANLLLVGDPDRPTVKLVDLGLATVPIRTDLTGPGQLIGTPHYMSPEQIRSDTAVDHRADLYALGVVLYELVCGRRPFRAEHPVALMLCIVTETPPSPRKLRPDIPQWLDRVIVRAMQPAAEDRYASASEMLRALREHRLPGAITASQPPGGSRSLASTSGVSQPLPIRGGIAQVSIEQRLVSLLCVRPSGPQSDLTGLSRSAIEQQGGVVRPLIGGEVIGLFGLNRTDGDEPLRAVRAGSDVQATARDTAQLLVACIQIEEGAGIQLNPGQLEQVVASLDSVPHGVLICDETTRRLLGGVLELEQIGKHHAVRAPVRPRHEH